VNRRASLPGADELFRPTGEERVTPLHGRATPAGDEPAEEETSGDRTRSEAPPEAKASGRTSHDAKITVYLTEEELLHLEQARLRLQAEFGIKIDRGRLVREAIADLLRDLRDEGPDARIVRRLS
jgi:hypothetical protein